MTALQRLIWMQALWLLLALSYNAVSWWQLNVGLAGLSPTNPVIAFFVVAVIALPIIGLGLAGKNRLYFHLNWLFIFMTGSATYTHLLPYLGYADFSSYASTLSWALALLINLFGMIAGILATWQVFQLKTMAATQPC
jgi:hypothetical protein